MVRLSSDNPIQQTFRPSSLELATTNARRCAGDCCAHAGNKPPGMACARLAPCLVALCPVFVRCLSGRTARRSVANSNWQGDYCELRENNSELFCKYFGADLSQFDRLKMRTHNANLRQFAAPRIGRKFGQITAVLDSACALRIAHKTIVQLRPSRQMHSSTLHDP